MKKAFLIIIAAILLIPTIAKAQNNNGYITAEPDPEVFLIVNEDPEFPGGEEALIAFIRDHVQYPEEAKKANITGTVVVTFIIEKDGSLSNMKIIRDIGGGCGTEAVRVLRLMPKWKPGKTHKAGEPGLKVVRCQFSLPIVFEL